MCDYLFIARRWQAPHERLIEEGDFEFVRDNTSFYLPVECDLKSARATENGRRAFRQAVDDAVGYNGPWHGGHYFQWEWTLATLRSAVQRTLLHHAAFAGLEPLWAGTAPIHALVLTGHLPSWMPSELPFCVLAAPPDPERGWAGWKPASLEAHRCAVLRLREGRTRSSRRRKRRADAVADGGDAAGSDAENVAEDSDAEDSDAT
jgi:hypothetical protein